MPASHATGATLPPVQRGQAPPPEPATLGVYRPVDHAGHPAWAQSADLDDALGITEGGSGQPRHRDAAENQRCALSGGDLEARRKKSPSGLPYKVSGDIGADNLVARVETWVEHPVLGDLHQEFFYSG